MFCCPGCFPSRRDFLAGAASVVVTKSRFKAAYAQDEKPKPWIDAHCHVFNAVDLPIAEFITRTKNSFPTEILSGLIWIIAQLLKISAPTARDEANALYGNVHGQLYDPAQKVLSTEDAFRIIRSSTEIIHSGYQGLESRAYPPSNGNDLLLQEVQKRFPNRKPFYGPVTDKELEDLANNFDNNVSITKTGNLFQLINWVKGFSSSRAKIVNRLVSHYPADNAPLMLTPAWVDYSRWLGIKPDRLNEPSSLSDQIAVAGALTKAWARGYPDSNGKNRQVVVTSFAPFDPGRCLIPGRNDKDPVKTIEDALTQGKIIGCKLYPPMGFRASNNFDLGDKFPPMFQGIKPSPGLALDDVLKKLYTVCIDLDAPIMAHCGDSNFPEPQYGERADPEYWLDVIRSRGFSKLRLNLGHFGGVWAFGSINSTDKEAKEKAKTAQSWAIKICEAIHSDPTSFPNLYVDVGYASTFLTRNSADKEVVASVGFLKEILKNYPVMRRRILYGSDWEMVGMEEFEGEYPTMITQSFIPVFGLGIDNFRYKNASKFLGLKKNLYTYKRISKFLDEYSYLLDPFLVT